MTDHDLASTAAWLAVEKVGLVADRMRNFTSALTALAVCHDALGAAPTATHIRMQEGDQEGSRYMTYHNVLDGAGLDLDPDQEFQLEVSWLTPDWLQGEAKGWDERGSRRQGSEGVLDIAVTITQFTEVLTIMSGMPDLTNPSAISAWLNTNTQED